MNKNISEKLFEKFPSVTTEKWEETIKKELKGADYEKKLLWKTLDGINVKPYFRAENQESLKYLDSNPGEYPYLRGISSTNTWKIRQDIIIDKVEESNKKALDAISRGAESIGFNLKNITITSHIEFKKLIKGINIQNIPIHFISGKQSLNILIFLTEEIKIQQFDKSKVLGSVSFDTLGFLAKKGKFYDSEPVDFYQLKGAIEFAKNNLPCFKVIAVNACYFHNAGSSIVQELGYSLSVANEYISKLIDRNILIDDVLQQINFNFAVGSNYFMEIAKFRASRLLWAKLTEAYIPLNPENCKIHIHAVTSSWNKTIYDPFVNMLRTTTESMSAAIAGVDSLSVKPFDMCYKTSDDFSERAARNQQIILKEESYLSNIVDASGGSYYIENLTASIAEEAWKIFLTVEEKGGFIKAFQEGFIQDEIKKISNQRDLNLAIKKDILLGTNQYPNQLENASETITKKCFSKKPTVYDDSIATPLKQYRGARAFEDLRLKTEKHKGEKPKVFLFTFGNPTMRKARAGFSSDFFACAGFEIIENTGFTTIDEGVNECLSQKANIVIICSSDDEYAAIVPEIFEKLHQKTVVVIAGNPQNLIEQFKSIGINHFIYSGINVLEKLQNFQKELGIR